MFIISYPSSYLFPCSSLTFNYFNNNDSYSIDYPSSSRAKGDKVYRISHCFKISQLVILTVTKKGRTDSETRIYFQPIESAFYWSGQSGNWQFPESWLRNDLTFKFHPLWWLETTVHAYRINFLQHWKSEWVWVWTHV